MSIWSKNKLCCLKLTYCFCICALRKLSFCLFGCRHFILHLQIAIPFSLFHLIQMDQKNYLVMRKTIHPMKAMMKKSVMMKQHKCIGAAHEKERQEFLKIASQKSKTRKLQAKLRPEPTNEKDKNAIAIDINHSKIFFSMWIHCK